MTTPNVNVVLLNFPNLQKEMVVPNEDGSFTILINAKHSSAQQLEAYRHAMEHIKCEDFQKQDVQSIEHAAHNCATPETQESTENIPADAFKKALKRMRKERQKRQRQMEEYEKDMKFIAEFSGSDTLQASAEKKWLYNGIY